MRLEEKADFYPMRFASVESTSSPDQWSEFGATSWHLP